MQSDRLEELLRAEREVVPEPGAEGRIWAAIEHRLAHGPAPPSGADVAPGTLGGATAGGAALKVIVGLALVAAAVGGWAARERPGAPPVVAAAVPIEAAPEDRREIPAPAPTPEAVEAPAPALKPPVAVAPALVAGEPAEVKKKPRVRPKVEVAPPEEEPADFAAELELIGQIRGALKRGDSAGAIAGVDEHARRFGARGRLVQERLAYHVEALCLAGRVADARRVARDMLAKWPDSTHAPRVKSSCAGA